MSCNTSNVSFVGLILSFILVLSLGANLISDLITYHDGRNLVELKLQSKEVIEVRNMVPCDLDLIPFPNGTYFCFYGLVKYGNFENKETNLTCQPLRTSKIYFTAEEAKNALPIQDWGYFIISNGKCQMKERTSFPLIICILFFSAMVVLIVSCSLVRENFLRCIEERKSYLNSHENNREESYGSGWLEEPDHLVRNSLFTEYDPILSGTKERKEERKEGRKKGRVGSAKL